MVRRMARKSYIDDILRDWPYEPSSVCVRMAKGRDGREVIQMRIEMGILQLETSGRPDGDRPSGFETYFDLLLSEASQGEQFVMTEDEGKASGWRAFYDNGRWQVEDKRK